MFSSGQSLAQRQEGLNSSQNGKFMPLLHHLILRSAFFCLLCLAQSGLLQSAEEHSLIKDGDHIVFVGDSITGQGTLVGTQAWVAKIAEGLALVRPQANPVMAGLGGSGSTVSHWQRVEKGSKDKPTFMDDKKFEVGKTLDGRVDILVVMLGMNDVLSPSLKFSEADFDKWIMRYEQLTDALSTRCKPRVLAVATVTPCTEDPRSPKNLALAALNKRLRALAEKKSYVLIPTSTASYEMQALGRSMNPAFRVNHDFVHPGSAGHLAIAVGMLRGLGESEAAEKLLATNVKAYQPADYKQPSLSYTLERTPASPDDAEHEFTVRYQWLDKNTSGQKPIVKLTLPQGWTAEPKQLEAVSGTFVLRGPLDRAENVSVLRGQLADKTCSTEICIPAAWRVVAGKGKVLGWERNSIYTASKDVQPLDVPLSKGEGLMQALSFPGNKSKNDWSIWVASNDYTGLDQNGSVDFAGITFFGYGYQAYGARWIYSERARQVHMDLGTKVFAGVSSLGVWLNGASAYAGNLMSEPKRRVSKEVSLHKGWNLIVFKSSHLSWQWQFSVQLRGVDADDLADLRYATVPPK